MRRETPSCLPCFMTIALSLMLYAWGLDTHTLCSLAHAAATTADQNSSPPGQTQGELQLFWNAPTTNRDSSPLQDLAGYKLHYGASSGTYTTSIDVGNQTTYTLQGLEVGRTYYIAVTAYDTAGNESVLSAELVMLMTPTGAKEQVTTPLVRRDPGVAVSPVPQEKPVEDEKPSRKKKRAKEQTEPSKVRRQRKEPAPSSGSQMPSLMPTVLVRGQQARLQVTGTSQGDVVFFLFSMEGTGQGPCAPDLGSICVDLLSPQVFGQVTADASGTANLVLPIPAGARAGQQVSIQAVVRHGAGQESHVKTEVQTIKVR